MLKEKRIERGLSQAELAERSGVNIRLLQNYEQGARNIDGAKLSTLIDISIALNCEISEILTDETLINKCKKAVL